MKKEPIELILLSLETILRNQEQIMQDTDNIKFKNRLAETNKIILELIS